MFCESELPTPDPADEAALYPPVAAWEPVRRLPRRLRLGGRLQTVRGAARPEWTRTTPGLAPMQPNQAHCVSLEYPTRQSDIPEFQSAETTNLVAQSAFLKPATSAQVVTQCTMSPRVQFLGATMQKPDFFSARTNTNVNANAYSLPGLSTTGFASASAIPRLEHAGFQHSAPPLLTAERLNGYGARWLQSLPVTVRPLITAKRHPHIVNKFSILWGEDEAVDAYFDELLISARPGRRGFAMEVLDELVELQRAVQEQRRF
jgi:hypothetical protein